MRLAGPVALVLLAGCAVERQRLPDASWFACHQDSQCEILQDPTCTLTPVNRSYSRRFSDWMARAHSAEVKSGRCPESRVRYFAECEDAMCTSTLRQP